MNETPQGPRTITLTLPSWPVLAGLGLLFLGTLAVVAGAAGWWAWSSWQDTQRLQAARADFPGQFAALAAPLRENLARQETAAQKFSGSLASALQATRASSIVPARLEADAALLRQDAAGLREEWNRLAGLEAALRDLHGVKSPQALAGPVESAQLDNLRQRVDSLERAGAGWDGQIAEAKSRRETLLAQAAAAEKARQAAAARARAEAREAAERAAWVRPSYSRPVVAVAPSWGWHAATHPVWGHYSHRPRYPSYYGHGCGPVRHRRSGASFGVSFVFR